MTMFGSSTTTEAERAFARLCDANDDGDAQPFEMDADDGEPLDYQDITIVDLYQGIDTNLWLAESYSAQGADGLALECMRAAWRECARFHEILAIYAGAEWVEKVRMAAVTMGVFRASVAFSN